MKNKYEVSGEVTEVIIESPKYGRFKTLIDTEDLEYVKEAPSWYVIQRSGKFYVYSTIKGKNIPLHRYIMKPEKTEVRLEIDHIYHDPLDNRKSMLRIVTQNENQQNAQKTKNNTSGITGVYWNKAAKKWQAYIVVNRKQKYLGIYEDIEDAANARKEAEEKYFQYKVNLKKEVI